jgi:toxin ParE1/3/4
MAVYKLSPKAAADLEGIYEYTILQFGLAQAQDYLTGLHRLFYTLADHPMYGRSASQLAPELRRAEYQSHVIFYQPQDDGVLIVRVLHGRQDVRAHLGSSEEP